MGNRRPYGRWWLASLLAMVMVLVAPLVSAQTERMMASVVQADRITPRISDGGKARVVPVVKGEWAYMGEFILSSGVSKSHQGPSESEEYLYILAGTAILEVDDETYLVGPRMGIYLPAGADVRWNNGPDPLVAVQVFAGPSSGGPHYQDWGAEQRDEVWPRPRIRPRPIRAPLTRR